MFTLLKFSENLVKFVYYKNTCWKQKLLQKTQQNKKNKNKKKYDSLVLIIKLILDMNRYNSPFTAAKWAHDFFLWSVLRLSLICVWVMCGSGHVPKIDWFLEVKGSYFLYLYIHIFCVAVFFLLLYTILSNTNSI